MHPRPAASVPEVLKPAADWLLSTYNRLYRCFGPQHWWPARTPFEVCVGAVLTQNASWKGVEQAISRLRRAGLLNPDRLRRLPLDRLARLIRPAGCYNVKAARLRSFLTWLEEHGGMARLRSQPTARLRSSLLSCHGIGPETADSILLYALNRPVFVIDAYTRRILSRHNLLKGDEPYARIQSLFTRSLPRSSRLYNEYHALLVRLAKTHCRPRPRCDDCPLQLTSEHPHLT